MVVWWGLVLLALPQASVLSQPLQCRLPQHMHCLDGRGAPLMDSCINKTSQCDGIRDCVFGSDEFNCETKCGAPAWWRCNDGECVMALYRCNGQAECGDESDELDCTSAFTQDAPPESCHVDQFRCANGNCIPFSWRCNGEDDCNDQSDEFNCTKLPCPGFICDNGDCIIKSWRCDGNDDCGDNSDEANCTIEAREHLGVNVSCELDQRLFECKDKSHCLVASRVCNREPDCTDGSDEGGDCHNPSKMCTALNCTHGCMNTPGGAVCPCAAGLQRLGAQACQDLDECHLFQADCSQRCHNLPGSYHCSCDKGYTLMEDQKSCKADDGHGVLVFSIGKEIRAYELATRKQFTVTKSKENALGVAYDGKHVYWTDATLGVEAIFRSRIDGSETEVIVKNGVGTPEDIAIDWLTGNLYFVDSTLLHIGVCTDDGLHCSAVLSRGLHKPRAIVLHPSQGEMYWTDWGNSPRIAVALMDGTEDRDLVTEDIMWPNGLTMDYGNDRLYWVDGHFDTIMSVRTDGKDKKKVLEGIHHPYWLSVFEDRIYFTEWGTHSLQSCHKFTGKQRQHLAKAKNIYGVHIYHPVLAQSKNHACTSSPCEYICLLRGNSSHSCACPEDKILHTDGVTCRDLKSPLYLIMGVGKNLVTVYHQILGKQDATYQQLPVNSIDCITYDPVREWVIVFDGTSRILYGVSNWRHSPVVKKLADHDVGTIEGMDIDHLTHTLYWCDSSRGVVEVMSLVTLERAHLLTGLNGDKPLDIALVPERGFMFVALHTSEGHILIARLNMDGSGNRHIIIEHGYIGPKVRLHYDRTSSLLYISDSGTSLIETVHIEGTGRSIYRKLFRPISSVTTLGDEVFWAYEDSTRVSWNNYLETESRTDKKFKTTVSNKNTQIHLTKVWSLPQTPSIHPCLVHPQSCSHLCVQGPRSPAPTTTCLCPTHLLPSVYNPGECVEPVQCDKYAFHCRISNTCIDVKRRCDGTVDCVKGEDEMVCPSAHQCSKQDQFQCSDGQCVPIGDRCDKHPDCHDGSDEHNCTNYDPSKPHGCRDEEFRCSSGMCLDYQFVCDGRAQCQGKDDEENCEVVTCHPDSFQCRNGHCIPKAWECDGEINCPDFTDEHNDCPQNQPCAPDMFRCMSSRCVDLRLRCNHQDDCGDGSDEMGCLTKEEEMAEEKECKDDEYSCELSTVCIPYSARCNGSSECPSGDDEADCPQDFVYGRCVQRTDWPCDDGKVCIRKQWRCDGIKDCMDGSDEDDKKCNDFKSHHGPVFHHLADKSPSSHEEPCEGGFRCNTGHCIDFHLVCDGTPNCEDESDEGGSCGESCSHKVCDEFCHVSPHGAVCSCGHGRLLAPDGHSCTAAPPACSHAPCPHLCHDKEDGEYVCGCYPGYQLRLNRHDCKAVGEPMSKLLVVDGSVRQLSSSNGSLKLLAPGTQDPSKVTGVDYCHACGHLYVARGDQGRVDILDLHSGKEVESISKLHNPVLLSLDWVTSNLYFVSNSNDSATISVCSLHRRRCAIIKDISYQVSSLIVDPINRVMFYAIIKEPQFGAHYSTIFKMNLDGKHNVEFKIPQLIVCRGLTVDYEKKILYFADQQRNLIRSIDYEGTNIKMIARNSSYVIKPLNLDIFEDEIYFLTPGNKKMTRCSLFGASHCFPFNLPMKGVEMFKLQQSNKQKLAADPCKDKLCSHLCVAAPLGHECLCSDGSVVDEGIDCKNDHLLGVSGEFSLSKTERSSSASLATVCVLFILCCLVLTALVYYRFYHANKTTDVMDSNYSVHFQNPGFLRNFPPLGASKLPASNTQKPLWPNQSEYENPLNPGNVPRECSLSMTDPKIIHLTQKIPGGRLQVPDLLIDSDSDAESERDEKTKLIV